MGLETRQQESGTEQRTVSFMRAGRCGQQGLCGIPSSLALSFLLYSCFGTSGRQYTRVSCVLILGEAFFRRFSYMLFMVFCHISLYIFFEIETFLDLALN